MNSSQDKPDFLALTAQIVAAFLGQNATPAADVPKLIERTHQALIGLSAGGVAAEAEAPVPAVPVKKSVFPDYIVCLEDGKKLKMLKRHLETSYGMTPDQYRQKWHLPPEYPMVAPNYAATRSRLAKQLGLGRKPAEASVPAEPEPAPVAKKGRGRPRIQPV